MKTHLITVRLVAFREDWICFPFAIKTLIAESVSEPDKPGVLILSHLNKEIAPVTPGVIDDVGSSDMWVVGKDVYSPRRRIYHPNTAFKTNIGVELLMIGWSQSARATEMHGTYELSALRNERQ